MSGSDRNICTLLRRHLGQRTVLCVAIPVLAGHIDAAEKGQQFEGLTEKEIQAAFGELATKFIKSEYHSTYIDRRLGPRGFLDRVGSRYTIRHRLMRGVSLAELRQLNLDLIASLRTAYEQRQAVIKRLEDACSLPTGRIAERHALVKAYLSQLTGNRGEKYEEISFAILREYFRNFGFSLQRFSTTHANDGGMDFVASEAIYQVTTDESVGKIRRDLAKSPGIKRVLVRPT